MCALPTADVEILIAEDSSDCRPIQRAIGEHMASGGRRQVALLHTNAHAKGYQNPSYAWNAAAKMAKGEVLIIAGAETYPCEPEALDRLYEGVMTHPNDAHFAHVVAHKDESSWREHVTSDQWLDADAIKDPNLYSGKQRRVGYFFLGAIARKRFVQLRGFDEDFKGPCNDDTDFEWRLSMSGSSFHFYDGAVTGIHQWHESQWSEPSAANLLMLHERKGVITRNPHDTEWERIQV